jgi:hypothetical protein
MGLEFVWPVGHFGVDIVGSVADGADDLTAEYSRATRRNLAARNHEWCF